MKTLSLKNNLILIALLINFAHQVYAQNGIVGITPSQSNAGTTVSTIINLNSAATPPLPPSNVQPKEVRIGSIESYSFDRTDETTITANFDIPSGTYSGMYKVEVSFETPNGSLTYTLSNGFQIGTGGDGDNNGGTTNKTMGLFINEASAYQGYTLFAPMGYNEVYLINMNGEKVHSWQTSTNPALSVYLLENGNLVQTSSNSSSPFKGTGGAGGEINEYDWDGNLVWTFQYSSSAYCSHHDVELLPNDNYLIIAWESKTESDAIQAGRNPSTISDGMLWPDHIIEVEPDYETGSGGTTVWEWHVWDHLIQDYDNSKENFGSVADHPELIDINYAKAKQGGTYSADWNHLNSIEYIEEYDQILLSSHSFSEIWIIDHSTTSNEAKTHSGGTYGKGGDLLYRWGNPQAYDSGTASNQMLFSQHNASWIEDSIPGNGNILIFNNGANRTGGSNYSSVDEILPPVDGSGNYTLSGSNYGPASTTWQFTSTPVTNFYSQNISGVQRLQNGNTLICDGNYGAFCEVTSTFDTVWYYISPVINSGPLTQGDEIPDASFGVGTQNSVFRCTRYSTNYPAFTGKDLTSQGTIEKGTVSDNNEDNHGENTTKTDPSTLKYPIVDTGQKTYFDDSQEVSKPSVGDAFYGQDANYNGHQMDYTLSSDGKTVYDNVTRLTWTSSIDLNNDGTIDASDQLTWTEFQSYANQLNAQNYGGFNDWRAPNIKELYSLIYFEGTDPNVSSTSGNDLIPFIDTEYFEFNYGDIDAGDRIIDVQYWSTTEYVSTTMVSMHTVFGVNFADGRIKGYGMLDNNEDRFDKYAAFVRGNTEYGINDFLDNNDGTISDNATGLMWSQNDNGVGVDWEDALAWVQQKNSENYLGYNDWRLPNAKELQSIVDYTRSPSTSNSPSINPVFSTTSIINEAGETDYPFFWTGTTHKKFNGSGSSGVYVSFGRGIGSLDEGVTAIDVHGAGCQRSDPKSGNESDYPLLGQGPQGDVQRVFNYVRLVRDFDIISSSEEPIRQPFNLKTYPNPVNDKLYIKGVYGRNEIVQISMFDISGRIMLNKTAQEDCFIDVSSFKPGIYILKISNSSINQSISIIKN